MYFYKDLFATLCFLFFAAALAFKHPYFYFGAMMCGALSTTAHRKMWPEPIWATLAMEEINKRFDAVISRFIPKKEFSKDEEVGPLPPLD